MHVFSVCDPWNVYDNAYIPGYNDDVGFSLTIEECQTRCMQETMFKCQSFDYWKARRQCYLSSKTATGLGIRLRRDSRMVHYTLNDCATTILTTTTRSYIAGKYAWVGCVELSACNAFIYSFFFRVKLF